MALTDTPRSNRLHIAFYGRRNAGKSSLINLVTGQQTALVSEHAGTTTDPVIKSMELLPLGPIAVIDTAGLDDEGDLGALRIGRSKEMMDRTDLAVLVVSAETADDTSREREWLAELRAGKTAVIGALNKTDRLAPDEAEARRSKLEAELGVPFVALSANDKGDRAKLLSAIVQNAPSDFEAPALTGDICAPGAKIVLVAPQDIQAPKGRLILPQVQVIRDILDNGGSAFVCTADRFRETLGALKEPPALVITDSQVFKLVDEILPREVPLTSFSIIMARAKGELSVFIEGAKAIEKLAPHDKVLIAEACAHAPLNEDIGREKLPRWLRQKAGETLSVEICAGQDFPKNLSEYSLILHCGGCMFTRKQLMSRIIEAREAGVPITNYGVAIAQLNGILDRVTEIFRK